MRKSKFRLKKKNIDLFDDELEDSSDESEIEVEYIYWFVFLKTLKFSIFCFFLRISFNISNFFTLNTWLFTLQIYIYIYIYIYISSILDNKFT